MPYAGLCLFLRLQLKQAEANISCFISPAPNALEMLKKFGRSLFKSKSKKQKRSAGEHPPIETESPEVEASGPPAPYGVPPPPAPAPIVSETAPQIEAPKPGTHILLQRDESTGFANFSIDISKDPAAPVESAPKKEEATPAPPPPPQPAADITTTEPTPLVVEPTPAPEVPKVQEAPTAPDPVVEAPKVEVEAPKVEVTPAPAPTATA